MKTIDIGMKRDDARMIQSYGKWVIVAFANEGEVIVIDSTDFKYKRSKLVEENEKI